MEENQSNIDFADEQLRKYYESIINSDNTESVEEYKQHMDSVRIAFLEKTRIQGIDIGFLFLGVMLQCIRIYALNKLTEKQEANAHGGREDKIKDFQKKTLDKFKDGNIPVNKPLYASLNSIISLRGVPYDASEPLNIDIKGMHLLKGANHRYSTLGHSPILGLVFGTSNILTNTITTTRGAILGVPVKVNIPRTNHVVYDELIKNPKIAYPVSTLEMLQAASNRVKDDKPAVAAAVIKQLIHTASDMYTPCGIQLPGANLILNNQSIEQLSGFLTTGDVIKIGASAGIAVLINTLIAAIHGSKITLDSPKEEFDLKMCQARTRKVIMYSNLIATSSSIIPAVVAKDVKTFDIGGLAVTLYRVFSDTRFICSLEEEFINTEVSKIYEEKEDYDFYIE